MSFSCDLKGLVDPGLGGDGGWFGCAADVVATPYFSVTGKDGSFAIKGVPAGAYTLKTWSEDGKPTTQSGTVGEGAATVEITVKK